MQLRMVDIEHTASKALRVLQKQLAQVSLPVHQSWIRRTRSCLQPLKVTQLL